MLRRSLATAYAKSDVRDHIAAAITGHAVDVFQTSYVTPHRDQLEREDALQRLLESGFGE